ncbi:MAG: hypothetical protein JWQ09_318 [Segetibacter sp.]|nr:hypothetical protein [Segetibacter sp.]
MKADLIEEAAHGNKEKELELLRWEVKEGTKEIQIYTRLSELYRKKQQYREAIDTLLIGLKIINHI